MTPANHRPELQILESQECRSLLEHAPIGRLAIVSDGRPLIFPVNYIVDGESIVFRTADGSKLDAALRGEAAAMQVDSLDHGARTGESVLVVGHLHEVTNEDELLRIESLGVQPWASGHKPHVARLDIEKITGRSIMRTSRSEFFIG
jgi:uncharacterized protein